MNKPKRNRILEAQSMLCKEAIKANMRDLKELRRKSETRHEISNGMGGVLIFWTHKTPA
jgi:hypothetical protein